MKDFCRAGVLAIALAALCAGSASAQEAASDEVASAGGGGVVAGVLWYLPNRVLDLFDVFRLRARVGPGIAGGLRATKGAELFVGSYFSVYAGLPGPRGRKLPRLPAGLEQRTGVAVGPGDLSTGGGLGPDYGVAEIGGGLQAAIVGLEIGVDPLEFLDLLAGFLTIDLRDDDF